MLLGLSSNDIKPHTQESKSLSYSTSPRQLLSSDAPLSFLFPPFTSVGAVLKSAFKLFKDNPALINKVLFAFYLPPVLLLGLLPYLTDAGWLYIFPGLLFWLISTLIESALIYGIVVYLRTGANPSLSSCLRLAVKKWWPVFAVSLVTRLIITLGTLLLIIPGIILSVKYSLVVPVTVIEGGGVGKTMDRSSALTQGLRWRIFGTFFTVWLVMSALSWIATGSSNDDETSLMTGLLMALTNVALGAISTVITLIVYLGIRVGEDEVSIAQPVLSPSFDAPR